MKKFALLILLFLYTQKALSFGIIRDDETESVIKEIASPLLNSARLKPKKINFYIVDDDTVNAFFAGGDNIFINTGLIKLSNDNSVLAGVLAHELGHMLGGHILLKKNDIERLNQNMILSTLAAIAIGLATHDSNAGMGAFSLGQHLGATNFLKFNRAQESAADENAIRLMQASNVSPKGIISLLKHFAIEEKMYNNDEEINYYRTHPVTRERIGVMESFAQRFRLREPSYLDNTEGRYKLVSAKIDAYTSNPEQTIKKYAKQDDLISDYALAIAYMKKGDRSKAFTYGQKIIQTVPNNPYFHEMLGQIYFKFGDLNNSIIHYDRAVKLKPKSPTLKWEYATVLIYAKRNLDTAVKLIESTIDMEPTHPIYYHTLSGAYNAMGKKAEADLALAYFYYNAGDEDKARKILARVTGEAKNSLKAKDLKSLLSDGAEDKAEDD